MTPTRRPRSKRLWSKATAERHHDQETVLVREQLEGGAFRWPPVVDGPVRLTPVEFAALFDGLGWTRVQSARRTPTPAAPA